MESEGTTRLKSITAAFLPPVPLRRASASCGFTLVELPVVVGLIAILIAILLPVLSASRAAALQVACASNLRQIGIAMSNYVVRSKGYLPFGSIYGGATVPGTPPPEGYEPTYFNVGWDDLINADLGGNLTWEEMLLPIAPREMRVLTCPADQRPKYFIQPNWHLSYAMPQTAYAPAPIDFLGIANSCQVSSPTAMGNIGQKMSVRITEVRDPARTFLAVEKRARAPQGIGFGGQQAWSPQHIYGGNLPDHRGRYMCLFIDSHVEAMLEPETLGTGTPLNPRGMWTRQADD